jgi:2-methylcitrate dehydratase
MTPSRRSVLRLAAGAAAGPPFWPLPTRAEGALLAEKLAAYANGLRYDDLDAATIERVKVLLVDTLGCGLAAFDDAAVRICREVALSPGGGPSTVIGTDRRTTPDLAAFANGAAFRNLDLNDIYVPPRAGGQGAHPSDHIAACLAVAEAERASAKDLMVAIVVAYEINCRLADAVDLAKGGWDPPVLSLPAVALAAGKLMRLAPDRLVQAVNLAVNDHIPLGQTRAGALSHWKGLADAEANRNAVFAARLARAGLTGPAPIFEGRWGFFKLVAGAGDLDVGAFGGREREFRIHRVGMKPYPVVVHAQTSVLAGIGLARQVVNQVGDLDRIAAIEIATTRRGFQMAGSEPEKWTPRTRETADHSLPYIAARALVDGDINLKSYAPDKLGDPKILALMAKISVKPDPAFDGFSGAPPVRMTAILHDGSRIVRQVDNVPGFPGQPMTRADVERKFRGNVEGRLSAQRTDDVLRALWAIDQSEDVSSLLGGLVAEKVP